MRGSAAKSAGILQPVIEPAKQNRIRIEQRLRAEIRGPDAIAPRNMHPRPGDEVLVICARSSLPADFASFRKPSMLPFRYVSYHPEICSAGTRISGPVAG